AATREQGLATNPNDGSALLRQALPTRSTAVASPLTSIRVDPAFRRTQYSRIAGENHPAG
ncbi:MAG: hypothetical protein ABSF89_15555, partial [Acidimicrobiales bacterium]